jgi:hypothetical protein
MLFGLEPPAAMQTVVQPLPISSPLYAIQAIYSAYDLNSPFCKFRVSFSYLILNGKQRELTYRYDAAYAL